MATNESIAAWYLRWYFAQKGGPGSGNYGHRGRPGMRGGSMPGGFSLTGGWDAPKPLEGQPDLAGESTDALYRTLTGFRREIKETESPRIRQGYQGAIENIQQELTYRGKLKAAITTYKQSMSKAGPEASKRIEGAIIKLEDTLDKREGIERIKIPTSSKDEPSTYELANEGIMGRYTRTDGPRGVGVMMRGADGKYYAYKGNWVFSVTPDEANMRGEVPRYRMAYRSKSLDGRRAWMAGFAVAQKGGPGSGNWGHAGRKGQRGGSLPRSTAMSLATGRDWQKRQQETKEQATAEPPEKTTTEVEGKGKIVEVSNDSIEFSNRLNEAFDGVPAHRAIRITLTARGQERTGWGAHGGIGKRITLSLPAQGDPNSTEFYTVGTRGAGRGSLRWETTDRNVDLAKQGRDPATGFLGFRQGTKWGRTPHTFDKRAEQDRVLEVRGQSSVAKPGISRAQMARFYKRAGAVDEARRFQYRDRKTAYDHVTEALDQGLTTFTQKPGGRIELSNPDTGAARLFHRTQATNLIRVLLNQGEFAANY